MQLSVFFDESVVEKCAEQCGWPSGEAGCPSQVLRSSVSVREDAPAALYFLQHGVRDRAERPVRDYVGARKHDRRLGYEEP